MGSGVLVVTDGDTGLARKLAGHLAEIWWQRRWEFIGRLLPVPEAVRLTASLPQSHRPPSLMIALHVWALSHGIASLFVRPDPSRRKLPMSPEELLEAGVLIYLQSLGLAGRPSKPS